MKQYYKLLPIIFMMVFSVNGRAARVDVLSPSATINANVNQACQNTATPIITFTGSGGMAPYTFTYQINAGTNLTVNTSGTSSTVSIPVSTTTAGTFTYHLIGLSDSTDPTLITQNGNETITILQAPDATLNGTGSGSIFNGIPVFRICTNTISTFTFTNGSNTSNTNYTINWGDTSPNYVSNNFNTAITHEYQIGLWNMVYTVNGSNGCSTTKSYIVFVGSNPAVSLGNPGNTDICISEPLTFPITGTANNPPGTVYTVSFNDGSPPQVFTDPPPASVTHTFLVTSCGTTSSDGTNTYPNSFYANIVATNPCSTSSVGVVPIYVSTPPVASFTLPSPSVCINTQFCLTSTSTGNENLGSGNSCTAPKLIWTISPATGYTFASGFLGNDFGSSDPNLWTSGSDMICPVFSQTGIYTITLKTANRCGVDTEVKTICVESQLTPQFTLSTTNGCVPLQVTTINTTNETVSCTAPTYTWSTTYTPGYCGSGPAGPVYVSGNASSSSPVFSFTTPGTYILKLTAANSCGAPFSTQTITVKQPPTASITGIVPNYCGSATINPSASVNTCAPSAVTYAWSFPGGSPTTSIAATPGTITYATAGNYTVSVAVTGDCGIANTSQVFSVNEAPVVSNSPLAQQICSGSPTAAVLLTSTSPATTFSWTATGTAGITGFTTSGNATIPIQTISTSNTSAGTVTYAITPMLAGCPGPVVNYVVTVIPAPSFTSQPAAITICQNAVPSALSVSISSATGTPLYQWYSNTTAATIGGTLIPGATNPTYLPPTNTIGIIYYYCVVTLSSGGCTAIVSNSAEVNVLGLPSISAQPLASQNICIGITIPTPLTVEYSAGTGTALYQWYSNAVNSSTGGTPVLGATSVSYTPAVFTVPGTYYYYAIISLSGNGCGSVTTAVAAVNVYADPVVDNQPLTAQTLCQFATPTILEIAASGGNGPFSYQWYSNTNNSVVGGSLLSGATSSIFSPPTSAVGTVYYYAVITQTATPGCSVATSTAGVTVIAAPQFTTQPVSSTVCQNGSPTLLTVAYINGVGTPAYQWYSNAINSNSGGTLLPSATAATFAPSAGTIGTFFYYCAVTLPSSGGCNSIISDVAQVIIEAGASITAQPMPSQTLCVGATLASPLGIAYTGGTGTVSYQWYLNATSGTIGGAIIPGANSATYIPPVFSTTGTKYFYVVLTFAGNGCGTVTSAAAEIIIVPDPLLSTQPLAVQELCQGATPAVLTVAATGGIGTFSYQWYSNTVNTTTSGTMIAGETSASFLPPTANTGTIFYYCMISQTGLGCTATSTTAKVDIIASPFINSQPQPSTVCEGGTPAVLSVTYTNGTPAATYQWYLNTVDANSGGTAIPAATAASFSPPSDTVGTVYYYCMVTLSSGGCSSITSETAAVTITAAATISTQPLLVQTICAGGAIPTSLNVGYMGGTGTATYQWFISATNSNSGGNPISGATASSFMPGIFASSGNFYYYVVITLSGNGCGSIISAVAEVIVVADPVVTLQPISSQEICQNVIPADLSVTTNGGIPSSTFSYQWYSNPVNNNTGGSIVPGATSFTFTPPTAVVGTFYYYCEITQPDGPGCGVNSEVATVIVNLAPIFTAQPLSDTLCLGDTTPVLSVAYSNGAGVANYQWYSNTTGSTSGGVAIPGATSATFGPPVSSTGITFYYAIITLSSGGCSDIISDVAQITVNQYPVVTAETTVICSGNSFNVIPDTSTGNIIPAGTAYTWAAPIISPAGAITGTLEQLNPQSAISQLLINTTTSPATATYLITPVSGACPGASFTLVVTVNPSISPNVTVNNILCFGAGSGSLSTNITGGIPFSSGEPYGILWAGLNGFTATELAISGLQPGDYTLTVTDAGGCPFTGNYTITQPPEIAITTNIEKDISCFNSADGEIQVTVGGGTGTYFYTWIKDGVLFSANEDISGLSPGTYTLSVTDENNCGPATAMYTITQPPLLVVSLLSHVDVHCYGESSGVATISVVGGVATETSPGIFDYTYLWTGPNGFISSLQNLNEIAAGTYDLSVSDNSGCIKTLSVTITQPTEILITAATTPITCYGANNASITLTVSGGVGPYTAAWSNLATGISQDNLSAGNYTITITDSTGCTKLITVNIPEAPLFDVTPAVTQVSCHGANDASINLNFVGGVAPVILTWSDGSTSGTVRNNIGPGTYTVSIVDATPCTIVRTFVIIEPQELSVSATIVNAFACDDANSGSINATVSGGTPPFNYTWSNGAATEDLTAIPAGNYLLTVTDIHGCSKTVEYSINRQPPIVVNVNTHTDFNCGTHYVYQTFEADVSGGIPPYQLQWSSGTVSGNNNQFMHTDTNGTVVLNVIDNYGCTATYTFDVETPEIGDATFAMSSIAYSTYSIYSVVDPIQFTSDITGDYVSIAWSFGDGEFSTDLDPVHSYVNPGNYIVTQTVTYPFGCIYVHTISLLVEKGYLLVVPSAFTPNRDGLNDTFRPVTKALKSVKLDIYDTWGSLIFSEQGGDTLVGWNGKIKEVDSENGNYYCKVTAETFYGTIIHENHPFVLIK
jgi:gliding motility-associated-like protein